MNALNTLVEKLCESSPTMENHVKILNSSPMPSLKEVEKYIFWKSGAYVRNLIKRTEDFELILFCWDKDSIAPLHNHSNQWCWMSILQGELKETYYSAQSVEEENPKIIKTVYHNPSARTFIDDTIAWHSVQNVSQGKSISLNIYNKPIDVCKIYSQEKNTAQDTDLLYHSVDGKIVADTQ